ncbi:hypothetical protein B0I37DRAFT_363865 [Chaetomium sp. MPI-CAGE-AT-0009]|nr:hypothetical protein B0I37DRAFT_363865 [Chaetomium sp. MPI-CAGE-AT-0009]
MNDTTTIKRHGRTRLPQISGSTDRATTADLVALPPRSPRGRDGLSAVGPTPHPTLPAGSHRELWSSLAGWIPLVAHVCHEARSVALKHVEYMTNYKGQECEDDTPSQCPRWDSDWGVDAPVRLRKGIDIVHLHWHNGYKRVDMASPPDYPWAAFQWLVNQAAAASVSADLLLQFDTERENPYTSFTGFRGEDVRYFSPHRLYYAVLAIVEIHISAEEAAQAGVFGVLGEQPIRLVDPRDTATITKFRDVWRRHQSGSPPDKELDVAEFFYTAIDGTKGYCARIEQWRRNLEKAWVWYKGVDLDIPWPTRKEFWPNWGEDWDDQDSDGNDIEPPYGWFVNWNRQELRREHPWVQTQLALMPRFEPAIMFRHCVGWCGRIGYANRSVYLSNWRGRGWKIKRLDCPGGEFRDIAIRPVNTANDVRDGSGS